MYNNNNNNKKESNNCKSMDIKKKKKKSCKSMLMEKKKKGKRKKDDVVRENDTSIFAVSAGTQNGACGGCQDWDTLKTAPFSGSEPRNPRRTSCKIHVDRRERKRVKVYLVDVK